GFARLAATFRERYRETRRLTAETRPGLSDLQFTSRYRVPFQYRDQVGRELGLGTFVQRTEGPWLVDLDGNRAFDCTGAYGVNVLGWDFYKRNLAEAEGEARTLGPVLGAYHPTVADNVARLRAISGLDEVSFHMSGTEAVMQAVRLARHHTGRRRLVRFCGAYHGWWGDVQPGIGNPVAANDTLTLAELSERTLHVLSTRRDVACVLVNPLQAMHPNAGAPSDSALIDSSRHAQFDRAAYTEWLAKLRKVCTTRGIVLILDEVFLGFRLARGGAQDYFNVRADLVTYGKTLGGGLPVGVLCGRADLMRRFRDDRPVDICFARGTFNAHPQVMGAMSAFLDRLEAPEVAALYDGLDARWDGRAAALNRRLEAEELPVRLANLQTVWTVLYTRPSRYNWMLQFYLRAAGLHLSWVGSGRLIFNLAYTDADFAAVSDRFTAACAAMKADGWWDGPATTNKAIRRGVLKEAARVRLGLTPRG
ncbi:MAG: aminotransferase class III-fold pyridoxal phosphate-dependent enzyme, partial [Parafilimonas terrae]|nr:aminotransferase class III-fold pyridoxal phosphate-dependent enzyme [Parafilimonas terrae]